MTILLASLSIFSAHAGEENRGAFTREDLNRIQAWLLPMQESRQDDLEMAAAVFARCADRAAFGRGRPAGATIRDEGIDGILRTISGLHSTVLQERDRRDPDAVFRIGWNDGTARWLGDHPSAPFAWDHAVLDLAQMVGGFDGETAQIVAEEVSRGVRTGTVPLRDLTPLEPAPLTTGEPAETRWKKTPRPRGCQGLILSDPAVQQSKRSR